MGKRLELVLIKRGCLNGNNHLQKVLNLIIQQERSNFTMTYSYLLNQNVYRENSNNIPIHKDVKNWGNVYIAAGSKVGRINLRNCQYLLKLNTHIP